MPSKFTLYTTLAPNVPLMFVIPPTTITPRLVLYVVTVPSNRFSGLVESMTATLLPVIYASSDATVSVSESPSAIEGMMMAALVRVLKRSPCPVGPVYPVVPVVPVEPVGPSMPSKFTLYTTLAPNVPLMFVMLPTTITPEPKLYDETVPSNRLAELVESTTSTLLPVM
jgi:hypothetical protein